ncbi:hypothetical protein HN51_001839 [Arachis hypogaea]|uniref:Dof zinc finger protein n=2 Tax=Arachis TaxID=3817 RepID=A0A445EPX4_ARAHY|nr:dof zinc finger protein DOF5.6 [Arachis duranensis]XP_025603463.1 dof zinc finger protein DOF5.6 [Arachis hypogaea]QHO49963.1 Dof zinc finger protein [Arachis hypogaea]RYR77509.1 hypothetical protein Ahy_A01g001994 [Arachis hypogaea]
MGFSSLHVCMDSSASDNNWLQGTINEEGSTGVDDSSCPSPTGDMMMIACSNKLPTMIIEGSSSRRLMTRPPQDQLALKCPRCESTHTKFCYYNNYSLSQPRYFCKSCRRYWTKGGTLRNIPVGGGCRKNNTNKKSSSNSSKKSSNNNDNNDQPSPLPISVNINNQNQPHYPSNNGGFPDLHQFSSNMNSLFGMSSIGGGLLGNPNFMFENNARPLDFMMESGIIKSGSRSFDFIGNSDHHHHLMMNGGGYNLMTSSSSPNYQGLCSSAFGGNNNNMSLDGGNNHNNNSNNTGSYNIMGSCQRLMLPYDDSGDNGNQNSLIDVKPNPRQLLPLDGKETFGSWTTTGMINSYGSSATNPLV